MMADEQTSSEPTAEPVAPSTDSSSVDTAGAQEVKEETIRAPVQEGADAVEDADPFADFSVEEKPAEAADPGADLPKTKEELSSMISNAVAEALMAQQQQQQQQAQPAEEEPVISDNPADYVLTDDIINGVGVDPEATKAYADTIMNRQTALAAQQAKELFNWARGIHEEMRSHYAALGAENDTRIALSMAQYKHPVIAANKVAFDRIYAEARKNDSSTSAFDLVDKIAERMNTHLSTRKAALHDVRKPGTPVNTMSSQSRSAGAGASVDNSEEARKARSMALWGRP